MILMKLRNIIFTGSLFLCSGNLARSDTTLPKIMQRKKPEPDAFALPNLLECSKVDKFSVGQEFYFKVNSRPLWRLEITGLKAETAYINISVMVPVSPPGPAVSTLSLTFRSIPVPIDRLYEFEGDLCIANANVVEKKFERENGAKLKERLTIVELKIEIEETLAKLIAFVNRERPNQKTIFQVIRSNSDEILLRTNNGMAFRLDRKIDLSTEFVFEKAGFLTVPYKIESLDSSGKTGIAPDRSRRTYVEVFMSEQAK